MYQSHQLDKEGLEGGIQIIIMDIQVKKVVLP
jgi:hypothetical protein